MQAFPQWRSTLEESARHYTDAPSGLQSIILAILAGSTITRIQQSTESDPGKIVATVISGFLLAGLQLFHCILDSLLIFGAIQSGAAISYLDWLAWFGHTLLFNMLGGLVLVTALRLLRTKETFEKKARADAD